MSHDAMAWMYARMLIAVIIAAIAGGIVDYRDKKAGRD